jgi:hypothetical protein
MTLKLGLFAVFGILVIVAIYRLFTRAPKQIDQPDHQGYGHSGSISDGGFGGHDGGGH